MDLNQSRRQFVRQGLGGLAVGTAAWAAPAVFSFSTAAAAGSPAPGGAGPEVTGSEGAGPEVAGSEIQRPNIPTAPQERPVGGSAGSPAGAPAPAVLSETATPKPATVAAAGAGQAQGAPAGGKSLPFTGFDPRRLLEAGVGSVVVGGGLVAAARTRDELETA